MMQHRTVACVTVLSCTAVLWSFTSEDSVVWERSDAMLCGGGELPVLSQAESEWSRRVPATVATSVKLKRGKQKRWRTEEKCRRIYKGQKRRRGEGTMEINQQSGLTGSLGLGMAWVGRSVELWLGLKRQQGQWMNMVTTSIYPLSYSKEGLTRVHIPRRSDIHCIEVNAVGRSSVCVRTHAPWLHLPVYAAGRMYTWQCSSIPWGGGSGGFHHHYNEEYHVSMVTAHLIATASKLGRGIGDIILSITFSTPQEVPYLVTSTSWRS